MGKIPVLLIDDEPETVDMLKSFLELFEFEVQGALTGADGLKLATHTEPKVIILDVMLPDADGFQICRLLRFHPTLQYTPIVILSARTGAEDERRGLAAGGTLYLRKPIDLNKLMEELRRVVQTGHVAQAPLVEMPGEGTVMVTDESEDVDKRIEEPQEPVSPLKARRATLHIPGLYIPRDDELPDK